GCGHVWPRRSQPLPAALAHAPCAGLASTGTVKNAGRERKFHARRHSPRDALMGAIAAPINGVQSAADDVESASGQRRFPGPTARRAGTSKRARPPGRRLHGIYVMQNTRTAGCRFANLAGLVSLSAMAVLASSTPATADQGTTQPVSTRAARDASDSSAGLPAVTPADLVQQYAQARLTGDFAAMEHFRPGYSFWQHVFSISDGSIAFGSATDGRLLAVFPARGDWSRQGVWEDPTMKRLMAGQRLATKLADRRD